MRKREIICEYQPYIFRPPVASNNLYQSAVANDGVTIERWRKTWTDNITANKEFFGSFKDHSLGHLYGKHLYKPAIVVGSGPSLKFNIDKLKDRGAVPLISCLHNFHYMEDKGVPADYYVSLDAGPVVVGEISEGGDKSPEEYWELTKDRTLIAFIGSDPELFKKWQGTIYLYNAPVPDQEYEKEIDEIEPFRLVVSSGGNVLGASMYIAKAFFGCSTIIFMGADFSFGYDRKFHSWNSSYDEKMGHCVPIFDVFGNKVPTWQSYANFKSWFDWVTINIPGQYINCTEGGCLGSYPEGNLHSIKQMDLDKCLDMLHMYRHIKDQVEKPEEAQRKIIF